MIRPSSYIFISYQHLITSMNAISRHRYLMVFILVLVGFSSIQACFTDTMPVSETDMITPVVTAPVLQDDTTTKATIAPIHTKEPEVKPPVENPRPGPTTMQTPVQSPTPRPPGTTTPGASPTPTPSQTSTDIGNNDHPLEGLRDLQDHPRRPDHRPR